MTPEQQAISDTRAALRLFLSSLGVESTISVDRVCRGEESEYTFQLRADAFQLSAVKGPPAVLWMTLLTMVKVAGLHHGLQLQLGLIDVKGFVWNPDNSIQLSTGPRRPALQVQPRAQ